MENFQSYVSMDRKTTYNWYFKLTGLFYLLKLLMAEHFQIITKKSLPKVNEVTFYDHFTALYSEPYVLAPFQAPSVEFLAEFLSSKYSISKGIYLTKSIINLYHSLLKKILSHNPKWVHNPQWLFQKQVTTLL